MRFFKKIGLNSHQKKSKSENVSNSSMKSTNFLEKNLENEQLSGKEEQMEMRNVGYEATSEENAGKKLETGNRDSQSSQTNYFSSKPGDSDEATVETIPEANTQEYYRFNNQWENFKRQIIYSLDRPRLIHWVTLVFIGMATWSIIYSISGSDFMPGSQLFSLILLFVFAYLGGTIISLFKLPSLLGMLITGILLRNMGFICLEGIYGKISATLREVALCIILIRAGLGLDPGALKSLSVVILRLACVPGIVEGTITTIVGHFLLGLPWLWSVLSGGVLAAVSPAVVIPCLFSLQERGYGTGKGIPTLVVAAASLDDIMAIIVFGIVLNIIYSTDTSLIMQILQGPLGILIGITFGVFWGFVAHFVPHQRDNQVVFLRVLMITGGGLMAIVGSKAIGYQGAGPLGCMISTFVACLGWRKQGCGNKQNPVAEVFRVIWMIFQPILFGLIGSEVDVSVLEMSTIKNSFLVLFCSLLGRIVVTIFIAFGAGFKWKEKTFIAWAWFPKATVQAALGPLVLDNARRNGTNEEIVYAEKILVLAVLAILITAPIGSILITILGPRLLTKNEENLPRIPDEGKPELRNEARSQT